MSSTAGVWPFVDADTERKSLFLVPAQSDLQPMILTAGVDFHTLPGLPRIHSYSQDYEYMRFPCDKRFFRRHRFWQMIVFTKDVVPETFVSHLQTISQIPHIRTNNSVKILTSDLPTVERILREYMRDL